MLNTLFIQQPIGLICGMVLAWWVSPTTNSGLILTILIGLALWNAVWLMLKAVFRIGRSKPAAGGGEPAVQGKK